MYVHIYIYKISKMPYLNITVFWCCGNLLDKRKLTYLIKQTLHVHFVEPINWLGLFLSFNWIMQSLKTVSAIFLYQQMIALKKVRKMLFIYFIKSFFSFSRYSSFYISLMASFSQPLLRTAIWLPHGQLTQCYSRFWSKDHQELCNEV